MRICVPAFALLSSVFFCSSRAVFGDVLHQGGVFDFEEGFITHHPSLFPDRGYDEVGKSWGYWGQTALFQLPGDRWGHPSFNGNRFPPNMSSGTQSQEITMTSANGDAIMWMTFPVPKGHVIRCSLDAITTPSEDDLQLRHALWQGQPMGIPESATDPFQFGLDWKEWDIRDTNNHFATYSISAQAATDAMTYYFWVRHAWATQRGATLCFDNLVVHDDSIRGGVHIHATTPERFVMNGNFEADGDRFGIPYGWVPYGHGGFGSAWENEWHACVSGAHPGHSLGLSQVVHGLIPGSRYRLTAIARCGSPMLSVKIGLGSADSDDFDDVAWSESHNQDAWVPLSVERTAISDTLTILLELRNHHPEYTLLEAGSWDDVRLEKLGDQGLRLQPAPTVPTIPLATDAYAGLANLWSLAWPREQVRTYQASSHAPDQDSNTDYDRVEGTTTEGTETWTVLKTLEGPGTLTRLWMTNFEKHGRIRIDIDGLTVFEDRIEEFFGGGDGPFSWPLVGRTSGACMSYVPVPFRESAQILLKDAEKESFYWQITYQLFGSANGVRPFSHPLNPVDTAYLEIIRRQWRDTSVDPKPPWPGAEEVTGSIEVPAVGSAPLWTATGPGMIGALWLNSVEADWDAIRGLTIQARWDGASEPQVNAPLGLFFASGSGRLHARGLLIGLVRGTGGYCFFPMPFRDGAEIVIQNPNDRPIPALGFKIRWVPLSPERLSPLRFHTTYRHSECAGEGDLYVPLDVSGRGHFVGLSGVFSRSNRDDIHFLEGDEYVWVDGEKEASIAGTGTEDYFTCGWYFFDGPITLAPIGATEIHRELKRVSAYRLHVPDFIPFKRSLRFGLEVGNATHSPECGNYRTLAFYYSEGR